MIKLFVYVGSTPAEPLKRCTLTDPAIPAHEEGGNDVVRSPEDGDDERTPKDCTTEEIHKTVDDGDTQEQQARCRHPQILNVVACHEAGTL